MDFVYFIILVSSLIFVHELGHFLFAKAFGVKVLTFSLGFGPKILKLRGRETEYCISLLPLGGYVKMLEESKSDVVLPEDRQAHLRVAARLQARAHRARRAGDEPGLPGAALLLGVRRRRARSCRPRSASCCRATPPTASCCRAIASWRSTARRSARSTSSSASSRRTPGKPLRFKVFRDNRHVDVEVAVGGHRAERARARHHRARRHDRHPAERAGGRDRRAERGVAGVSRGPAHLRRRSRSVGGAAGAALHGSRGGARARTSARRCPSPTCARCPCRTRSAASRTWPCSRRASSRSPPTRTGSDAARAHGHRARRSVRRRSSREDSYLHKAGLRPGDKILRLDDEPVPAWSTFRERVMRDARPPAPHRLPVGARRPRPLAARSRCGARTSPTSTARPSRATCCPCSTGCRSRPKSASLIRLRSATRSTRRSTRRST